MLTKNLLINTDKTQLQGNKYNSGIKWTSKDPDKYTGQLHLVGWKIL